MSIDESKLSEYVVLLCTGDAFASESEQAVTLHVHPGPTLMYRPDVLKCSILYAHELLHVND